NDGLIIPLLQSCKQINNILAFQKNCHLYSRIFRYRFDSAASARRLGTRTHHSRHLAHQLVWYSRALKCIRRADIYDNGVLDAFWASFALMSENDGKNRHLLEAAGLPDFVDEFVRKRLYEDSVNSNGWPTNLPSTALHYGCFGSRVQKVCLTIFFDGFFSNTPSERLKTETTARRNEMIRLVLPFVIVPFRYPSAHAPHNHFTMPLTDNSHGHLRQSIIPAHGPFPLYRADQFHTTHFYDRADLDIGIPLASTAAKLIFFSRRQTTPIGIPIHLPLTRQHAIQLGFGDQIGPTQEDVHELNQHKVVKHAPRDSDSDTLTLSFPTRRRLVPASQTVLTLWRNLPSRTPTTPTAPQQHVHMPEEFTEQQLSLNAYPLFMRLREYHCVDPQDPVPTGGADDGFDDGISNAWIPKGVQVHEDIYEGKLRLQHHDRTYTYEAYRTGSTNSHDEATCRGCQYRGTCNIIYREHDDQFLAERSSQIDEGDADVDVGEDDDQFLQEASVQYDSVIDDVFRQRDDEAMDEDTDTDLAFASDDESDEESIASRGSVTACLISHLSENMEPTTNSMAALREWDGLVALVRIPAHPHPHHTLGLGLWVFSGYIVGGHNFVGTWRALGDVDPVAPTLESSFAMTRREEGS
ncbi:hypothetical protein F4604DRAFT_2036763, partial [Suillus subluteus]